MSIPVTLFPASRPGRISLRMVAEDGTPLRRRFLSAGRGRTLAHDDVVRGYEIEKGRFVVVGDEELERLEPEKSREIDLRRFVPAASIDRAWLEEERRPRLLELARRKLEAGADVVAAPPEAIPASSRSVVS